MDGLVDGTEPGAFHVLKALPDEAFASLPFVAVGKASASLVCSVPDRGLGGMLEVVDRVSSVDDVIVLRHRHQRRPVDPVDRVQAAARLPCDFLHSCRHVSNSAVDEIDLGDDLCDDYVAQMVKAIARKGKCC